MLTNGGISVVIESSGRIRLVEASEGENDPVIIALVSGVVFVVSKENPLLGDVVSEESTVILDEENNVCKVVFDVLTVFVVDADVLSRELDSLESVPFVSLLVSDRSLLPPVFLLFKVETVFDLMEVDSLNNL